MDAKSFAEVRHKLQALYPELQKRYGVQGLWLFGSQIRGEAKAHSDLDVLVEFDDRPLSLFKFMEIEIFLTDHLGVKVDLVERASLKPTLGAHILAEAVAV